jgi:hypothetical protein
MTEVRKQSSPDDPLGSLVGRLRYRASQQPDSVLGKLMAEAAEVIECWEAEKRNWSEAIAAAASLNAERMGRIARLEWAVKIALDQSMSDLRNPRTGKMQSFEDDSGERLWFITDDAISALNATREIE